MQQKVVDMQEQLAKEEFTGSAGGGLVSITVNGKTGVNASIDESLLKPEEKEMLEDLVIAAMNDARQKADERMQAEMGNLTGGMGLPADFKLPF